MGERSLQGKLSTAESVVYAVLDGEGVLLDTRTGVYFGLDGVGTRIWELLDASPTCDEIVRQLLVEYEVDEPRLSADVTEFLHTLVTRGLVKEASA